MAKKKFRYLESELDTREDKYKFLRNISFITGAAAATINPLLFVPFGFLSNHFHIKAKKVSNENIDLEGNELKPIGSGSEEGNGIFFGMDEYGLPIHLSDDQLTQHGIIFGATGSGKTVSIFNIIRQQTKRGGGWIFIDGKSENPTWLEMYKIAKEVGREDEIFLLSFRADFKSVSNSYNFLLSGSSTQIGEQLFELALPADAGQNQVFIDKAKQLMLAILSCMTYLRDVKKEVVTIQDLINMLKHNAILAMLRPSVEDVLKDKETKPYAKYWIPEDYVEKGMSIPAKQMLRDYAETIGATYDGYVPDEAKELFKNQHTFAAMSFGLVLADMSNTYGRIFNTKVSDINLSDIIANNRMLYILLPSLEKSEKSLSGLGKMVLAAVKQACSHMLGGLTEGEKSTQIERETKRKRARPPFLVIPDEYGSYAVKGFSDVLAQARSLGISVIISVQERASLDKAGAEEAKRILGNTLFKVGLRIEELETAKFLEEIAGTAKVAVSGSFKKNVNDPYEDKFQTEESFSLTKLEKADKKDFKKFSKGQGVFIYGNDVRKFQMYKYDPKVDTDSIYINKYYPTIELKINDDNIDETEIVSENIENIAEQNTTDNIGSEVFSV